MAALLPGPFRFRRLTALAETLATPHALDRYLELVNPMATVHDLRAEVLEVQRAAGSVTLTLRPTWQWSGFSAGQYVQIGIVIGGVRHTRCFSPVTSQHGRSREFDLTIKAHPDGLVSQHLYQHAEPGLVVSLAQAAGVFRLPADRPQRIVLISGGSGITPVLSMLRTLADEGYRGEIAFLHYARSPEMVPHRAGIASAAGDNVRVAFGYDSGDGDVTGPFGPAHLESVAPWFRDAHTYVCGPAGLMTAVKNHYQALEIADRVFTEEFTLTALPAGPAEGTVSFSASGIESDNTGATLLEQAEAAGLNPEYGCRMGICFSCTAIKKSGCTRNVRTGETDSDPDQPIQLCINAPAGDVVIDI